MNVIFVLGSSDPEMSEIEELLRTVGVTFVYAHHNGSRVHPRVMYQANPISFKPGTLVVPVECGFDGTVENIYTVIDHHCEGDPGYGKPPELYWEASSLGQTFEVLKELGYAVPEPTKWQRLAAAADHCLGAAYKGQCPGIDPTALAEWRVASRASYQKIRVGTVLNHIVAAMEEVENASEIALSDTVIVADMRREKSIKELPEAAMRMGVGYVAGPLETKGGYWKYTASGCPAVIRAFMEEWAPAQGLLNVYGDPMRGFAGAYIPE